MAVKEKLNQIAKKWEQLSTQQVDPKDNLYIPLYRLAYALAATEPEKITNQDASSSYSHLVNLVIAFDELPPLETIGYWAASKIPGKLQACFDPLNEILDEHARNVVLGSPDVDTSIGELMTTKVGKKVKPTDECCQADYFQKRVLGLLDSIELSILQDFDADLKSILVIYLDFLVAFANVSKFPEALSTLQGIAGRFINLDQKKARMRQRIALFSILNGSLERLAEQEQ